MVTHAGGKELEEPLVVRPTSETIIGEYHGQVDQLAPRPAHAAQPVGERGPLGDAARGCSCARPNSSGRRAIPRTRTRRTRCARPCSRSGDYARTARELAAMPVVEGEKTPGERFAGAVRTFTIEGMMRDGRALQAGTSHYMGTNFARAFDIQYTGEDGSLALRAHHVLGHEHPHDRRRDHDARRRQGPGAAAAGGAVPGGHRPDRPRRPGRRGPRGRERRWRGGWPTPASGRTWTTGPSSRRASSSTTGNCAACRSGWSSGRATWPRAPR